MKYKLVIFDLDGTILDTLEDLSNSVNYALKNNNLTERSTEEIRSFVGNGIRLLIERSVPENTDMEVTDRVFSDFKSHYKNHSCDNTKPYDGITDLINRIKSSGALTAVVSNKADFAVKDLVFRYFDGLFDFSVGEREGVEKKPAPDSVFEVVKASLIDISETVYVGDSEVDIRTAENAGVDCIIVSWGFRDRDYLIECGADVIADTVSEVSSLLHI